MVDFKFIFDFGSPKTYLVYKLLPGIEKRTNIKAEYVPVLLGGIFKSTNNVSPIESFKTVPAKGKYDDLDTARFVKKHNITICMRKSIINIIAKNRYSKIIKFKVNDSKNFEKIKLDGVKFTKSNGQITASYDKNKIRFDQIIEEVKNNVEILDISTDEGDLEDIFLQVTNK